MSMTLDAAPLRKAPGQPNLLVIFTDDQVYQAIGYGNPEIKTPHLDALARDGIIFEQTYAASPICAASRASMMTGVYPQQHGVIALDDKGIEPYRRGGDRSEQTLARQLTNAGYDTAFFGKSHLGDPKAYGFAEGRDIKANKRNDDGPTFEQAARFLDTRPGREAPFLLWLAPHQPHVPLLPSQTWLDLYPADELSLPGNFLESPRALSLNNQGRPGEHLYRDSNYRNNHRRLPAGPPRDDRTMREFTRAYYAVVSHLDHQVGQLVERLRPLGMLENTVIVFLSDNGYHLGSHGLGNKITMHEESVRVPMFMTGPGLPRGIRSQALASGLDVYPTLLELARLKKLPKHLTGQSLMPVLRGERPAVRETVFSECVGVGGAPGEGHRMVRWQQWKLVLTGTDEQFLFDLQHDPTEQHNRINDPALKPVVDRLRRELQAWMASIGDRDWTL